MGDRIYDIILSCGCMVSLDGGGGLIACDAYDNEPNPDCRYDEEYRGNPKYKEWEEEIIRRNS